ncbi:MAG: glycosyltransferase family 2 protein [Candidatus Hydrogenedentes bacterium]|nr:glycosyltransferase family 2 protein [Candidatus Hydrogenedentota bacterium]
MGSSENTRQDGPFPVLPGVSVVVPTYREAANLPELLARLDQLRREHGLDLDVFLMDDDSRDGTEEAVARAGLDWVRLTVRTRDRGLSAAVMDGFRLADKPVVLVMDADLSHPPEKIPEMLAALAGGADFVIGSRYAPGGTTAEDWGLLSWINSRAATLPALPFTRVKDPMSGFFAFPRTLLDAAPPLNAVGYKIGLEVLVKCGCRRAEEVPIHFAQRHRGESKLSLREQLLYLRHLRRLAVFKYGHLAHFSQFALVGFLGTLVNLAALTALDAAGVPLQAAVALAIFIAMLFNFVLNRQITFAETRGGNVMKQLGAFVAACSVGGAVNYAVTLGAVRAWPALAGLPQAAAVLGILAGLTFNYLASRYWVFGARRPR